MKMLWIYNINYDDAKSLADHWESYLHNVGCKIYTHEFYNKMIITWESSALSTIHHILDFIDDAFGDAYSILKLESAIKDLQDDHIVIFDPTFDPNRCVDARIS